VSVNLSIPVHADSLPVNIKVSRAGLSLAKNEIGPQVPADLMGTTIDITNGQVSFLKKEYDVPSARPEI